MRKKLIDTPRPSPGRVSMGKNSSTPCLPTVQTPALATGNVISALDDPEAFFEEQEPDDLIPSEWPFSESP